MAALFQSENIYSRNYVRSVLCKSGVRNKNDTKNCQLSKAMCQNKMQSGKHLHDKKTHISFKSVTNSADSTDRRNRVILPNGPDRKSRTNAHKRNCSTTKAISPRKSEDNPYGFIPSCSEVDVTRIAEDRGCQFNCLCAQQLSMEPLLSMKPYVFPLFPNKSEESQDELPPKVFPIHKDIPQTDTEMSSDRSENVNENNARSGIQSRSFENETHLNHSTNSNSGNYPVSMKFEQSVYLPNVPVAVYQDRSFSNGFLFHASGSELCVDGSSYSSTGRSYFSGLSCDTDLRTPTQGSAQQNRPYFQGQVGSSIYGQDQQCLQHDRGITLTEPTRLECNHQQRNGNEDIVPVLGHVRSPEHAKLTARLRTFSRWPTDIEQTPALLAEAGFYYTGFQDTVRCFACDGGLKNWDPEDDPWIEHARWFPQCLYVRHIKGEEFINLVRMASQESDEEDDYTANGGAASGGVENSNISADSASSEITEPSVLESVDAQAVMQMGFPKKDVVMAINNIFKKGKQEFTCQEIVDILLEKDTRADTMNSMLAVDSSPSVGIMSAATEHAMNENRRLKELLLCIECKSRQRNILFLPCTHCVVCDQCSRDLHICTQCYRKIKDKFKTYMS